MPAKNLLRVSEKDTYLHIYNKGVEGRSIFVDKEDYDVFLNFLREYLIDPSLIETQKKTFTVNGKTYTGTPHLPKNYYKKVELVAYALTQDHFHLVLHQRSKDIIQSFIRSLCTRYSIYFNKKYSRRGSLFEGPYKSAHIEDLTTLVHFINYLHSSHKGASVTSYNIYNGRENATWMSKFDINKHAEILNPEVQIKLDGDAENEKISVEDQTALSQVVIEKKSEPLERRILDKDLSSKTVENYKEKHRKEKKQFNSDRRIPEYIVLTATFVVFLGLGLRNISNASNSTLVSDSPGQASQIEVDKKTTESSAVLSASESASVTDPLSLIYSYVVIKKGASTVVYKNNDVTSGAITTAHAGDHFVAYPVDTDWYQVRFTDNTEGYILSKYIDIEQKDSK